jgi:hypothetical protein
MKTLAGLCTVAAYTAAAFFETGRSLSEEIKVDETF